MCSSDLKGNTRDSLYEPARTYPGDGDDNQIMNDNRRAGVSQQVKQIFNFAYPHSRSPVARAATNHPQAIIVSTPITMAHEKIGNNLANSNEGKTKNMLANW